jgi:hypothetical protein
MQLCANSVSLAQGCADSPWVRWQDRRCRPTTRTYTLGEIATRIEILEVRCDRAGRYVTARLVAEHGPDADSAAWVRGLVADCPKHEGNWYERCDPHSPALAKVF